MCFDIKLDLFKIEEAVIFCFSFEYINLPFKGEF